MKSMFHSKTYLGMAAVVVAAALPVAAVQAQVSSAPVAVRTDQSLIGVAVGNGRVAGQPVVDVSSKDRPLVGVGALSGKKDHFGSAGTLSVANDARIVGVDGPGGVNSPNSVSVRNPKQAPIFSH